MGLSKLTNVKKVAGKGKASTQRESSSGGVPRASELGDVFLSPKRSSAGSSQTSDVVLCVLQYATEASMFGSMFAEGDLKVIHLLHEQGPSVF